MAETDRNLAIAAQAGKREAFDALVIRHGPGLLSFLRRMVNRAEDAQDLFQEVFLRAYKGLGRLKDPDRFRSWLVTIAANAARRHYERRGARPDEQELEDEPAGLEDESNGALDALETEERQEMVRRAMERLPPRQKAVLSLRLDLELPFQEIAGALGITEENARAHHYQALRSLRRRLGALAVSSAPRDGESR